MVRPLFKIAFISLVVAALYSFTNKAYVEPSKTIVLIPYQPMMYLSDADADIAAHSRINVRQVRSMLRNALTERMARLLREDFYVRSLTEAGTAEEKDDLSNFYDSESFYLSSLNSDRKLLASDSTHFSNPFFSIFRESSAPKYSSSYMNVSLAKPALFLELSAKYEADYFLVLTQLEIKTHYNECIDIANRVFRREFLVHFAIFDSHGNQQGGTAVSCEGGSDINTVGKITYDIFPGLIGKVCGHVSATTP